LVVQGECYKNMPAYKTRTATHQDIESIERIWLAGQIRSLGGEAQILPDHHLHFQTLITRQDEVFQFFLVEDRSGLVVAWSSLMPVRNNPVLARHSAEISLYSKPDQLTSAGSHAATKALQHADRVGLQFVFAFISTENFETLRLADSLGFTRCGFIPAPIMPPHISPAFLFVYTCDSDRQRHRKQLSSIGLG
jgi:L-amino acid N-acyltransferase YncA